MPPNGLVDEELVLKTVRQPLRVWYKLGDYIKTQRQTSGHYAAFVEYLAYRSVKYQLEEIPADQWTRLEGVDLVKEFSKDLKPVQKPKW